VVLLGSLVEAHRQSVVVQSWNEHVYLS
jgi:hypothetical protein